MEGIWDVIGYNDLSKVEINIPVSTSMASAGTAGDKLLTVIPRVTGQPVSLMDSQLIGII